MTQELKDWRSMVDRLFKFAERYATKAEQAGKGTQWPTVRQAARHLHVRQEVIPELVADYHGEGYMGLGVGYQVGGMGGGTYRINNPAEYVIEAYL